MNGSRKFAIILLISISALFMLGAILYLIVATGDATLDESKLPKALSEVMVYDREDKVLRDGGGYVKIEDISQNIQNAFIAVEDKRFYKHSGTDIKRLIGALYYDAKEGRFTQGGSTISNQLIKNTHLTNEKNIKRKLREAKITYQLERTYAKNEILEMYLNIVYFGKGIYGVNDACRLLYGKSPRDVSPMEAASLAATVANPAKYSVLINRDNNRDRSEMILSLMMKEGYLSADQYERAMQSNIIINYDKYNSNCDEIYIKSTLHEAISILYSQKKIKDLKGYRIYTYFDRTLQSSLNSALSLYDRSEKTKSNLSYECMIADNTLAGISAYISSNPTSPIKKQPGSLLKPFIYAGGIESGKIIPDTPLRDEPISFDAYSPSNFGGTYMGWISAREGLAKSVNTLAVSLLNEIGIDKGKSMIESSGIPLSDRDKNLAIALGGTTYGSTVSEICEGYMTLANQGIRRELSFIRMITDDKGNLIYKDTRAGKYAMAKDTAFMVTDMLMCCVKNGTAKQLNYLPYEIAAKTGTVEGTIGNSDAWCAAYTTEHTFVSRYSADNSGEAGLTGGNLPTKTIRAAMRSIYDGHSPDAFALPPYLKTIEIDKTIKDEFHILVPYAGGYIGEKERIYTTKQYQWDAIDPERLLIGDLSVRIFEDRPIVSFRHFPGVEYEVKINGASCTSYEDGYIAPKQRSPIGKLEVYCRKEGRALWKTTRLVGLYQR